MLARKGLFGFGVMPILNRPTLLPMWNPHAPKLWIGKALKPSHEGSLTRFAVKHHAINPDGTIDLAKAQRAADRLPASDRLRRTRQIILARNLRRFRRN